MLTSPGRQVVEIGPNMPRHEQLVHVLEVRLGEGPDPHRSVCGDAPHDAIPISNPNFRAWDHEWWRAESEPAGACVAPGREPR